MDAMLTRLKINGFKNLVDVDVSLGPFTCIAGVNGAGKSNLFDAILFLSALMDRPLLEAALSVRSEGGRAADLRSIFRRAGDHTEQMLSFEVEMLIPPTGVDNLGQEAKAATTFLRYQLALAFTGGTLSIEREELNHITQGESRRHLRFPHSPDWRKSVVQGRRTSPFISADAEGHIVLHQDQGSDYKGGGRPRRFVAKKLPRTVLSEVNAAESATAVLARQEIQSWRALQLEPSALRAPDPFTAPGAIAPNGAHMPATLARLVKIQVNPARAHADTLSQEDSAALYSRVANRLAELIEGVRSVRVDVDERRELLTLMLKERGGTEYDARSLSDGTLRFLALAILEADSQVRGVLCMEEPENGIHPQRIPAMLRLLQDLAVDPMSTADDENPLRQVIINTHSPGVAGLVPDGSLLVALPRTSRWEGKPTTSPIFCALPGTWRAQAHPDQPTVPLGELVSYLGAFLPPGSSDRKHRLRRVVDREDLQPWLPLFLEQPAS
jgi:predicted ATPase